MIIYVFKIIVKMLYRGTEADFPNSSPLIVEASTALIIVDRIPPSSSFAMPAIVVPVIL